jgi:putative intracellular protease/amidase
VSATIDRVSSKPKRVLLVVASPVLSTTLNVEVGFWASELTHPFLELTENGFEVDIASPKGGKVELDAYSDPRHESGYSAWDIISMGFLHTKALAALLDRTIALADARQENYVAILICGGQGPMFSFRENKTLQSLIVSFYEAEKPVAALCHGVAALMDVKLADGSYLIAGKTITGFANVEEDVSDRTMGTRVMPWHIEDVSRQRGANYIQGGLWKAFAVRDGRLITGQQQYSGSKTARLLIEALGA